MRLSRSNTSAPPGRRRLAIVVPAVEARGGLASVALFLYRTTAASDRYEPFLISLATSSTDASSVRVFAPWTWSRGPQIVQRRLDTVPYLHVGTVGAELEPFRYLPRSKLTALLETFDIVQLVAGSPALAHLARDVRRPIALQCATMVAVERKSLLEKGGLIVAWRRLMTRIVARMDESGIEHADLVLVENTWMHDRIAKSIGLDRVRFTPPGVDTKLFHPAETHNKEVVLAVGRLDDPRKNIGMLVHAFARVRQHVPGAQLILAGERKPTGEVMSLAQRLGIDDAIELRVAPPDTDLAELYRRATVFALSSDEEGLGIVVLEAMASGVPAVCTRCGGPETSVVDGETGFLVDTGDVEAFADRLVRILSNPRLREQMGRGARRHVEENFSLQRTGARFLEAYDELLATIAPRDAGPRVAASPSS